MAVNDVKTLPPAADRVSLTSAATPWAFSATGTLTTGLATAIEILGLTVMFDVVTTAAALDALHEVLIELSQGESNTLIAQVPFGYRMDTRVSHVFSQTFTFAVPLSVPGLNAITVRVADDIAAAMTYAGITLFYREQTAVLPAFTLVDSAGIPAGGTNTSAVMTGPGGGHTFGGGRQQDDENPADSVDLGVNQYGEWEWSLQATADAEVSAIYEFRVTLGGTPLTTYSVMPEMTIGTPAAGGIVRQMVQAGLYAGEGGRG